MLPIEEVLVISVALSIIMAILYRVLTNPEQIRNAKKEAEFYKEKMNKAQKSGDKAQTEKFMNEMLKAQKKQLGQNMKPMFASLIIFFIAFGWLGATYADLLVNLPFPIPFIGSELNWFWWYLIIVIPSTQICRKLLGVE